MKFFIEIILIAWSSIIAIIAIAYTINSQIRQRRFLECRKYRRQGAAFSIEAPYVYGKVIKALKWLRQKNSGSSPVSYSKEIIFVNHFDNVQPIIKRRK